VAAEQNNGLTSIPTLTLYTWGKLTWDLLLQVRVKNAFHGYSQNGISEYNWGYQSKAASPTGVSFI